MLKSKKDISSSSSSSSSENSDLDFPTSRVSIHPKSLKNCSRREKEIKVVGSVSKELSGIAFKNDLSRFQPSGGLLKKEVVCTSNQVCLRFSSPLSGISNPHYVKKFKCDDMISEEPDYNKADSSLSSVTAVKLNWRKGVKVEQMSQYSRRTRNIEPQMTTTDFDFESKIKFQKEMQTVVTDLFPENNVMILDGNECHGRMTIKSKGIQQDVEDSQNNPDYTVPLYNDQEEHHILLVPFHSKVGFDNDISKRYNFPYNARFTIDKKNYEHKFELRLAASQSPQHFGLIFTFPSPTTNLSNDSSKVVIVRSLLTIYSVFPSSSKHASLVTYSNDESKNLKRSTVPKKPFVKNIHETISSNLKDEKLVSGNGYGADTFSIGCDISHPNQRALGINRYRCSLDQADAKHKEKVRLFQNIKADTRESRNQRVN